MNPTVRCMDPISTVVTFCYQRQCDRNHILRLIELGCKTEDTGRLSNPVPSGRMDLGAYVVSAWRTDPFRELEFPVERESGRFVFRRHFRKVDDSGRGTDPFVMKIEFRIPCENETGHGFADSLRLRCEPGRIPGDTSGTPPWLVEEVDSDETVWRPDARWVKTMCAWTEDGSTEWQMAILRSFCSAVGTELARRNFVPTNRRLELGPGLDEI